MEPKLHKLYMVYIGAGKLVIAKCKSQATKSQYALMDFPGLNKEEMWVDKMNIRREATEADKLLYGS
jgi:hypothetical protein